MLALYRQATRLLAPFIPHLLNRRLKRGKEDAVRLPERFGHASRPRPAGKLLWIHAASVGEANTVLPLIHHTLTAYPEAQVLLTTVTVTSARLMAERLPDRAFHQFAPVDTPDAVDRFLSHWRPDLALFVDSELWPNLITQSGERGIKLGLVNARMSERSARRWRKFPFLIRPLLKRFDFCFAQTTGDAARLRKLGMGSFNAIGNLKYDADPLPFDAGEHAKLVARIQGRPVWLAASTHPGEEAMAGRVHQALKASFPGLLTLLVPRHAERGAAIEAELDALGLRVARRSEGKAITAHTDCYLGDTMGELGLFYRLSPIAFIGGSLVPHGGQNPLEAARLGCAVCFGPHMDNFTAICDGLKTADACVTVADESALADLIALWLADTRGYGERARRYANAESGLSERIVKELRPYLA